MKLKAIDCVGKTVQGCFVHTVFMPPGKRDSLAWAECMCGIVFCTGLSNLRLGHTKSCGCVRRRRAKETHTTHGLRHNPIYKTLRDIIERCCNKSCKDYHRYGGRGITVCERWRGPNGSVNFLADMGERPSHGHTIDRFPDKHGNYEPENCRWATATQQARNTRSNHLLTHAGETLCISEWAERLGINKATLLARLVSGWTVERALTTAIRGEV